MTQDALIMQIGQCIVRDANVDAHPWDGYALIARYDGPRRVLSGFRFRDGHPGQAATPHAADLPAHIDALRQATQVDGKAPWDACVIRIRAATGRITVDFAYEAAAQWDITPATLDDVMERARPA